MQVDFLYREGRGGGRNRGSGGFHWKKGRENHWRERDLEVFCFSLLNINLFFY